MTSVFIIYRNRTIYWENNPEEPWTQGIVCGCLWTEEEAWNLGREAHSKGYQITWAEVPLAFTLNPHSPPESVFIPGQTALEQDDPDAEEFSDFIPLKAYLTRKEAEQSGSDWDVVWEFSPPWIGRFALEPFEKEHSPHAWIEPHRYSL